MRRIWEKGIEETVTGVERKEPPISLRRLMSLGVSAALHTAPVMMKAFGAPALLVDLVKTVKGIAQGSDAIEDPEESEDIDLEDDPVRSLQKGFSETIHTFWSKEKRLTVLIDDLDRCSPEGIVSLIDSIRLLASAQEEYSCQFIVAIDHHIVTRAIQNKFSDLVAFDGNRYLEKVFPLSFHIPKIFEAQDFTSLLKVSFEDSDLLKTNQDQMEAVSHTLTNPLFSNPRLIKRTINRFELVIKFEGEEKRKREENRILADWIVAIQRWPLMRNLLQLHEESYWLALEKAHKEARPELFPGPEGKKLFEEPAALHWMTTSQLLQSPEIRQRFKEADWRLRRLGL